MQPITMRVPLLAFAYEVQPCSVIDHELQAIKKGLNFKANTQRVTIATGVKLPVQYINKHVGYHWQEGSLNRFLRRQFAKCDVWHM